MRTQEWIQTNKQQQQQKKKKKKKKKKTKKKKKKRPVGDTLVYGQTRARCVMKKKKKKATTMLKASSTRDTLETRHISVVRWRIRNVLVLALYALQIVQVERLSCNLCAMRSLTTGRDSYYRLPRNGMRLFCFLPVLRGCKP